MTVRYEDYTSTAAYFVARKLNGWIRDYDIKLPLPAPEEIEARLDAGGRNLYEAVGMAVEVAGETAYELFPEFSSILEGSGA